MKKHIKIEGMNCGNCVRHVEEALEEITGVGSVDVSLKEKMAVVEVNENVSNKSLKLAIEEVGYKVTEINQ